MAKNKLIGECGRPAPPPLTAEMPEMTKWIWMFLIVGLGGIATRTTLGQLPVPVAQPAQLSRNDFIEVQRIEDYLNSIRTVRARFRQKASSTDDVVDGSLYYFNSGYIS